MNDVLDCSLLEALTGFESSKLGQSSSSNTFTVIFIIGSIEVLCDPRVFKGLIRRDSLRHIFRQELFNETLTEWADIGIFERFN